MSSSIVSGHEAGAAGVVVASVQFEPRLGAVADNLSRSLAAIERAARLGAQIVVLPELANSGYVFRDRHEAFALAEPIPDGPSATAWAAAARRLQLVIVAGIAERVGDRLFNAAVVLGPQGPMGTYRKLHLWGDEHLYFEAGDLGLPVFDSVHGRLGVVICYDGWFPETYRLLAMRGVDIVCMPTNWVPMAGQRVDRPAMATTLAMANAHANGLSLICANRVGLERQQPFIGQSVIVGSDGWPVAGPASAEREELLIARIDVMRSRRARQLNAFNHVLRDRRDDLYDPMLGTGWPKPRT